MALCAHLHDEEAVVIAGARRYARRVFELRRHYMHVLGLCFAKHSLCFAKHSLCFALHARFGAHVMATFLYYKARVRFGSKTCK